MNILECVTSIQPYDFLIWAVILSAIFIFWKWHLNPENQFDVMDLVCEEGKLSSTKFMRTGSWVVMSYGFYLLSKTSPESLVGYAPLYGGIWVSARALDKWQQNNNIDLSSSHRVEEKKINISMTSEQVEKQKAQFYSVEGPDEQ